MSVQSSNRTLPLLTICVVFFVLGFATWVNAMLIPFFKVACQLTNFESYFVTFAFYISYLVIALPASFLLKRTGFKIGIMIGLAAMSVGALVFIPAAITRSYPIFLLGLFIIGTGLAILQTAANPYVTILGAPERAAQRISMMGICNKTAGIMAPLILAALIIKPNDSELFKSIPHLDEAHKAVVLDGIIKRVIYPYAVVSVVLAALSALIYFSPLPEIGDTTETDHSENDQANRTIFHYPHLILGAVAIFFHVGSQIIAIDTIITYAQSLGYSISTAKAFPSFTLMATIIGYLMGIIFIPWGISQKQALRICTSLGLVLSIMVNLTHGKFHLFGISLDTPLLFLISLGFANSMIWAGIWPLALNRLGKHLKVGASVLILGLCGNALLPLLYGYIADQFSLKSGYLILLPCYCYLIFYAFYGHKVKTWRLQYTR